MKNAGDARKPKGANNSPGALTAVPNTARMIFGLLEEQLTGFRFSV